MRLIDHANDILESLGFRRDANLRIRPITNPDLLVALGKRPSDYAVAFGQANSLLDIASMEADQPLIGRLVLFDHCDDHSGAWANWLPFGSLLYYSAPRLKRWSDANLMSIRTHLKSGKPSEIWKSMEPDSAKWLERAIVCAQNVVRLHVDSGMVK